MRKFVQPVRVFAPVKVQNELKSKLVSMGYNVDAIVIDKNYDLTQLVTNYRGDSQSAGNAQYDFVQGGILVDGSDLFLALAAMSEGAEFWPGEWVMDTFQGINNFSKVVEQIRVNEAGPIMKLAHFGDGVEYTCHSKWIRKATKEEIIEQFAKSELDTKLDREEKIRVIKVGGWPPRVAFERLSDNTYHYFHVTKDDAKDFWSNKLYKEVVMILPEDVYPYEEEVLQPEPRRFSIDQAKEFIAKHMSIPVEQIEIDGR